MTDRVHFRPSDFTLLILSLGL